MEKTRIEKRKDTKKTKERKTRKELNNRISKEMKKNCGLYIWCV
jgi:hypothetical protein